MSTVARARTPVFLICHVDEDPSYSEVFVVPAATVDHQKLENGCKQQFNEYADLLIKTGGARKLNRFIVYRPAEHNEEIIGTFTFYSWV